MSAADALIRATISALSASFSMTGPLAAFIYSVLPSTLSRVPATRCVAGCCADAVATANTTAKAAAVGIRIVLMSILPNEVTRGRAYTDRPNGEAGAEGARLSARIPERVSSMAAPQSSGPISSMRRLKTALRQSVGDIEKSERRAGHAFDRDNACHVGFCRRNDAPAGPCHSRCRSDPK